MRVRGLGLRVKWNTGRRIQSDDASAFVAAAMGDTDAGVGEGESVSVQRLRDAFNWQRKRN